MGQKIIGKLGMRLEQEKYEIGEIGTGTETRNRRAARQRTRW